VIVEVKDLKEGDQFYDGSGKVVWTAITDAKVLDDSGAVEIDVRWADGGKGQRHWIADDFQLPVSRPTRANASASGSQ
jgi:hypothetical protein